MVAQWKAWQVETCDSRLAEYSIINLKCVYKDLPYFLNRSSVSLDEVTQIVK